jgi:GT2 family glycosyltransferase
MGEYECVIRYNTPDDNLGVTGSLQWLYEHTTAPVIAFLHSDLEIFEPGWDARVLKEFDDPKVGLVGFGGGLQHGSTDIYKIPYALGQLARFDYRSNTTDAEQHGERFVESCEVAVLDGFALILRRELLDRVGGWPVKELPFHCYDYWAAIATHKLGYSVRLVGIKCQHWGGSTSTTPEAQAYWERSLNKTDAQIHEESHRFMYDYARGYLPWRIK